MQVDLLKTTPSPPPIEVCLSSWSLHSDFLNQAITAVDFPQLAREEFGVRHIEFYEGDFSPDFLNDDGARATAQAVAAACDKHGVRVAAIAAVNDFTVESEVDFERHQRRIRKWLEISRVLPFRCLRINSGRRPLNEASAKLMVTRLKELAKEAQPFNVTLVLENHPHILRNEQDVAYLRKIIDEVDSPNFGACPDLGACGPDFWKTAFERLLRHTRHVHVKSSVKELAPDGSIRDVPIERYLPHVRDKLLHRSNPFRGCFSYEYTEFSEPDADHRQKTRVNIEKISNVLRRHHIPPNRPDASPTPPQLPIQINSEPELSPPENLLRLLLDGCQLRLDANVRLHDLGTGNEVQSTSACHSQSLGDGLPGGTNSKFCALVDKLPEARQECLKFHADQIDRVRRGELREPRTSICPMGLVVLTMPVMSPSRVFGTISCGPWIEEGSEGMVVDAVARVPEGHRAALDAASYQVPGFTVAALAESRNVLSSLADDLAQLYSERRAALLNLRMGARQINDFRKTVHQVVGASDLEKFDEHRIAMEFQPVLEQFLGLSDHGGFLLARCHEPHDGGPCSIEILCRAGKETIPIDDRIELPRSTLGNLATIARKQIHSALVAGGLDSITPELLDSRVLAFFVYRDVSAAVEHGHLTQYDRILIRQLVAELEYSAGHLLTLARVKSTEFGLRFFISRLKHAIASCLQAIDSDVRELNNTLQETVSPPRALDRFRIRDLHTSLRESSNEAGSILKRLTGQVRLLGAKQLRPRLRFSSMNLEYDVQRCVTKHAVAARLRQVHLRQKSQLPQGLTIQGDSGALTEVIDNLLENAVKYAFSGTDVRIHIFESTDTRQDDSEAEWSLMRTGIRLTVKNTGSPVSVEDQKRFFEPFFQGKNVLPDGQVNRGTGIGLAICDQIVRDHSGRIFFRVKDVQSVFREEQSMTFFVDLPYHPDS